MEKARMPEVENGESLKKLPVEQLIALILQQQKVIAALQQEIERLKIRVATDSQTSSKPPSTDLLNKPTTAKQQAQPTASDTPKRKPGGQPGHEGKTRKGFGRVDRIEALRPTSCNHCGSKDLETEPVSVIVQQVAQLAEQPIEVVEYQRRSYRCHSCGCLATANWPDNVIPGQDLDAGLQAFLGWLGNYGQLPYEKQAELLGELGGIEVGTGTLVATNSRVAQTLSDSVSDNNLAERALRLAVTKRKVSGGSRSMERFEETAILLTAAQTCRFQGRSVMQFLREALMAHAHQGLPPPTLIPAIPS